MRDKIGIKIWLLKKGLGMSDIARAIGVSTSLVSYTIAGKKNSPRVLKHLKDRGVPEQILGMPTKKAA